MPETISEIFGAKTTKVVLSDEGIIDAYIRDAVKKEWKISPYEFCSPQEYEKIKEDTTYFFFLSGQTVYSMMSTSLHLSSFIN